MDEKIQLIRGGFEMKIRLFLKDIKRLIREKYPNHKIEIFQYGTNDISDFFIELEPDFIELEPEEDLKDDI